MSVRDHRNGRGNKRKKVEQHYKRFAVKNNRKFKELRRINRLNDKEFMQ